MLFGGRFENNSINWREKMEQCAARTGLKEAAFSRER